MAVVLAVALLAGVGAFAVLQAAEEDGRAPSSSAAANDDSPDPGSDRFVPKAAYLKDACDLPPEWVRYIWRGWDPSPARDADLVLVPKARNYVGSPASTPHSGPYGYLQRVPLVWYGPGLIESLGPVDLDREVTVADIAPTQAELIEFAQWPSRRSGRSLTELLTDTTKKPQLLVTISIDGGGWNVLNRWPDSWPFLKQLMDEGASVTNAVVGSSPSITPAVHTNMSTGEFPRLHGVTSIGVRQDNGRIVGGFALSPDTAGDPEQADPTVNLRMTTIGDLWDEAHNQEPVIGMVSGGNYVTGLVGFGAALKGADKDIAAMHGTDDDGNHVWATNPRFYSSPDYLNTEVENEESHMLAVDRLDGEVDGEWRGHSFGLDSSPAFAPWQERISIELLERERFGQDELTDLFYLHLKSPDAAGHVYNMIAPEQADVLRSVDRAIEGLVEYLDDHVERYVLTITADHGQTPTDRGGWAINRAEVYKDVGERFGNVIERTSSTSFFMDRDAMKSNGVTAKEVASFLSRYRIRDNIPPGEQPEGVEERLDERTFRAVFPGSALPDIVSCTGALEN